MSVFLNSLNKFVGIISIVKISVLADCHLGSGYGSSLENDPFENLEEAIEKSEDCDLILIAGDLFDSRSPRTTVWAKAISILTRPLLKKSGVNVLSSTKKLSKIHERTLGATPVVCLHGNHDRRMRDETNAVQGLDSAGILVHLHKENIVFEKDGVKVAVHGMSSVPERYAKGALSDWAPRPVENTFNILMIHQNVAPYVYSPLEPPSLSLGDMPRGFDMILDGHVHIRAKDKVDGSIFMILGSTVITQFDKRESELQKGFHKITFEQGKGPDIQFVPLENSRKFFYREVKVGSPDAMRRDVDKMLADIDAMRLEKKPVVKIKIFSSDTKVIDQDIAALQRKYSGKMVLSLVKQLESAEMTEKMEFMRNLREQKLSVDEIGLNLLKKNLEEGGFQSGIGYGQIFRLLTEGDPDKAVGILTGDQKTLYEVATRR